MARRYVDCQAAIGYIQRMGKQTTIGGLAEPVRGVRGARTIARRKRAVESFKTAADCIGPIEPGLSLFALTRGQFSMLDALLHVLDCTGPAAVSLWTWTIADYEVQRVNELCADGRITSGLLVIDYGAQAKNAGIIADWKRIHGPNSVRYVLNHAKIATVETAEFKVLLRGSMNLNFNPRFENLDITEGGADFDLVREIEGELTDLPDGSSGAAVYKSSRVGEAFDKSTLDLFSGVKVWAK